MLCVVQASLKHAILLLCLLSSWSCRSVSHGQAFNSLEIDFYIYWISVRLRSWACECSFPTVVCWGRPFLHTRFQLHCWRSFDVDMRVYLWTLLCAFALHVCLYASNHIVLITVALSCVLNSGKLRSETSKTLGNVESLKVLREFCEYFWWFCCCCLLFFKKYYCNLDGNGIECPDSFGKDGSFNNTAFSDPWTHNVYLLI